MQSVSSLRVLKNQKKMKFENSAKFNYFFLNTPLILNEFVTHPIIQRLLSSPNQMFYSVLLNQCLPPQKKKTFLTQFTHSYFFLTFVRLALFILVHELQFDYTFFANLI